MDPLVMRTAAMLGFEAARKRWGERWDAGGDAVHAWPPLAEVLWWACTVDENLWPETGYQQRRDADQDGRILRGVRWARNRTTHGLALLQVEDSDSDDPFDLSELRWAHVGDVPPGKADDVGEAGYVRFLDGRPVVRTVESLQSWLHRSGVFPTWEGLRDR